MAIRIGNILMAAALLLSATAGAERYDVSPGQLPSVMRGIPAGSVELTISGEATSADLMSLKYMPSSVTRLDISGLNIPEREIPSHALMATGVRTLLLPVVLDKIGEGAFAESALEEITLPSQIAEIAPRAFYKCGALKSVTMGDCAVREIPEECFYGCPVLRTIVLPSGLRTVGDRAFMRSALAEVSLPGVVRIGDFAFAEMPELSQVTLNSGAIAGDGVFYNDPNLGILSALPQNSPVLGFAANRNLTLPAMINSEIVEEGAFAGFSGETIVLGADVREIAPHAFSNAGNLKMVNVTSKEDDIPLLDSEAFSGVDVGKVRLIIPLGKEEAWRSAEGWKDFIIEEGAGVEDIPDADISVSIKCNAGKVTVNSETQLDVVTIYSLGGMLLYDNTNCGIGIVAGPFDEPEVIVRVSSGGCIKVGKYTVK